MSEGVFDRVNHQHGPFTHGRVRRSRLIGVTSDWKVLS